MESGVRTETSRKGGGGILMRDGGRLTRHIINILHLHRAELRLSSWARHVRKVRQGIESVLEAKIGGGTVYSAQPPSISRGPTQTTSSPI